MSIEFIWVPSHLGIKGNEYVDKLAQDAITKNVIHIDCCFETFEHSKLILGLNVVLEKWQLMWTACPCSQFYKKIEPKVSFRIKYHDNNRKNAKTITRLRFGKCLLNDYLAKMKITDSDKCTSCETAVESIFC